MTERDEGRARVVLVTGGASGIGLATAGVLVERGWRVVVADIDADRCATAAASIGADAMTLDVVDDAATDAALDAMEARFGPVAALMANAGLIQRGGSAEDLPLAEFDRVVAVNLRGVSTLPNGSCVRGLPSCPTASSGPATISSTMVIPTRSMRSASPWRRRATA